MSDLRSQIDSLSADEKAELLDAVWESIEADAMALPEPQRAELDRRLARRREDPSDVVPWEQAPRRPFEKAVTLPVTWMPEAAAEFREARSWYHDIRPQLAE